MAKLLTTQIYSKKISELSDREYHACHALNMGPSGTMRYQLETLKQRGMGGMSRAVMAWQSGRLVGWVLTWREPGDNVWSLHIYVRSDHRRMGIGRALYARARQGRRSIEVFPHNPASRGFYKPSVDTGRVETGAGYRI